MRPERLTIEGLTCFKDRQELDLRALELFAIAGPTGAGKSTLLDAIVLALYGSIPRVANRRPEMISSSRDRASVVLDFAVGRDRYRIARVLRRSSGAQQVRLEQHDGQGFNRNLADQVRAADSKIEEILGLNAAAFTQSVLLPQGEFAKFLKEKPQSRREMLCTLLRLGIYDQMRERAQRISNASKTAVDAQRKLLDGEYREVDEAALAALEKHHAQLSAALSGTRQRRDEAQRGLDELRMQHARTRELVGFEAAQRELSGRAEGIEQARAQLEAARRAAPLLPLLDEARLAEDQAAVMAKQAAAAGVLEAAARARSEQQAGVLAEVERAAEEIPALRQREVRLHQVVGRLSEVVQLEGRAKRQGEAIATLVSELAKLEAVITAAQATQAEQGEVVAAGRVGLLEHGYDAALDASLQSLRGRALKLGMVRIEAAAVVSAVASKREALDELRASLRALEEDAASASGIAGVARAAARAAEAAVHAAHRLDAASYLRGELQLHYPCPVCEQIVGSVPEAVVGPEVSEAEEQRAAAEGALAKSEGALRRAQGEVTRGQARIAAEESAVAGLAAHASELAGQVEREDAELRTEVGGGLSDGDGGDGAVEVWIEARVESLAEQRVAHERLQQRIEQAERAGEKARNEEQSASERSAERAARREQLEAELEQDRARLNELRREVAQVAESEDPAAECAAVVKQIDALEAARKKAGAEVAGAERQLAAAVAAERMSAAAAASARRAAEERGQLRDEAVRRGGFLEEGAIRDALMPESAMVATAERIHKHDQERHAVEARIRDLRAELGAARVLDEELERAEEGARELNAAVEQQHGEQKALEGQRGWMKERLARAIELRDKLAAEEQKLRLYSHLATDLRSDKFQAYLLVEAFTELVRGASERLRTLTGERYSLRFEHDEILVVDHDNAGETRISDTLSGGETFLTSLALALELSEHVQRTVGAVRLDSLFIDEGFGTLDSETLALVSEAIQGLRVGGRMVGIITHLSELRDELPQQILVHKHQGYSTVEVRGAVIAG